MNVVRAYCYQQRVLRTCMVVFCSGFFSVVVNAQTLVRYPQAESVGDARASYPVAILQLCAQRSGGQFAVAPSNFRAQQGRNIRQLSKGDGLDVIWAVADEERERQLLPIYIPIDRGLIGWRLLLVRARDKSLFAAVSTPAELARLTAGQGHDWPDVAVLRANGFEVVTSATYEGLFHMLALGHIQYFPRSLSEIWPEVESHRSLNLAVQDSLILHYQSGLYFFVNKKNTALADTLTACLHATTRDGTLKTLFNEYYGAAIKSSDLVHRRVMALEKIAFTPGAATLPPEYWFTPTEKIQ